MQDGGLLTTAMVSYLAGGRGIEHGIEPPELPDPESVPPIDELLRGYEDVGPTFRQCAAADRLAVHQRPDLGDARQRGAAHLQPGLDEGRRHHARRPGAATARRWCTRQTPRCWTRSSPRTGCRGASTASSPRPSNHSVWFHRPVRFDEWVLYSTSSPVAADSRGLGTGHFFDRSGQLLATVVQEGIVKYFPGARGSGRNLLL